MLKELKENVDKVKKVLHEQNGNISKEIGNIKKIQEKNLELKCTIINEKNHYRDLKAGLSKQKTSQ